MYSVIPVTLCIFISLLYRLVLRLIVEHIFLHNIILYNSFKQNVLPYNTVEYLNCMINTILSVDTYISD